jgi:hypothetical protein
VRDVVKVQDLEVFFQLLSMEEIGGQLRVIAAALSPDLLDDEL